MLVLTRKTNESIMIGDEIEVTVIDIRGDHVKIGISAPRAISVHRKEVYEAIRREKSESGANGGVESLANRKRHGSH